MVTQELLDNVAERYRQGQNKSQIKESLLAEGWEDIDIDQAVLYWQRAGFAQIPFVSKAIDWVTTIDKRTAKLPPHLVLVAVGFCVVFLLIVVGILFVVLDPFDMSSKGRDTQRQAAVGKLQRAVERYHTSRGSYPSSLQELAPNYLPTIPVDPKTQKQYEYMLDASGVAYKVCAFYETKRTVACLSNLQNESE